MTIVTFFRRLLGVVLVAVAGLIYVHSAEKGTFACERATGACVHTVERLTGTSSARTIPLSDVLGVGQKHAHWEEAPGARAVLARARNMSDVSAESLWVTKRHSGRSSSGSSTTVVFTRQGLVFPLAGRSAANADVSGFERFLSGEGSRFELVLDDRFSSLPLSVILLVVGVIVIRFRGPESPGRAE